MLSTAVLEARQHLPNLYATGGQVTGPRATQIESTGESRPLENVVGLTAKDEITLASWRVQSELALLAMHFSPDFRHRLLAQLKSLLSPSEWDEEDELPDIASFRSLFRALAVLQPVTRPMLGLSDRGNAVAMWRSDQSQLTLEHFANDRLSWLITNGPDAAGGITSTTALLDFVHAHNIRYLLDGEG